MQIIFQTVAFGCNQLCWMHYFLFCSLQVGKASRSSSRRWQISGCVTCQVSQGGESKSFPVVGILAVHGLGDLGGEEHQRQQERGGGHGVGNYGGDWSD